MSEYISCADTAKLIRKALGESFPDVKFSVRSNVYAGGASINIRYVDGPNIKQVESVSAVFSGAYFDGMTDYKGSTYAMMDGKQVKFGADFIFVNRDESDAAIQKALNRFAAKYAGNYKGESVQPPTLEDYKQGRTYGMKVPGIDSYDFIRRELNVMICKSSDRLSFPASKTAGGIIYLGNDGYSEVGALNKAALA